MTGARILIVDDDPQMLRYLSTILGHASYGVAFAHSGKDAQLEMARRIPDLILLDLMLPDMDGISLIGEIIQKSSVPIIMLSSVGEERSKVAALDAGADDYVTKPFGSSEILSRIRAVMRRWAKSPGSVARFTHDGITVDFERREVTVNEVPVHLTPKEYDLLKYMIEHAGKVLTHRMLLTALWGPSHAEQSQYLRVFIGQLRKKLEPSTRSRSIIATEPGVGYRLAVRS